MIQPQYIRSRIKGIEMAITQEIRLSKESKVKTNTDGALRNGFIPEGYILDVDGVKVSLEAFIRENADNYRNDKLDDVEIQVYDNYFVLHPDHVCGIQKQSSSLSFPVVTIGTEEDIINTINNYLKGKKEPTTKPNINLIKIKAKAAKAKLLLA